MCNYLLVLHATVPGYSKNYLTIYLNPIMRNSTVDYGRADARIFTWKWVLITVYFFKILYAVAVMFQNFIRR